MREVVEDSVVDALGDTSKEGDATGDAERVADVESDGVVVAEGDRDADTQAVAVDDALPSAGVALPKADGVGVALAGADATASAVTRPPGDTVTTSVWLGEMEAEEDTDSVVLPDAHSLELPVVDGTPLCDGEGRALAESRDALADADMESETLAEPLPLRLAVVDCEPVRLGETVAEAEADSDLLTVAHGLALPVVDDDPLRVGE